MMIATRRSRAILGAILFSFAASFVSFFASEPASAAVRYVRHCSWSHGYRHCYYRRYSYHRHHGRTYSRPYYYSRSYCYSHRCRYPYYYYYPHGWNNRW